MASFVGIEQEAANSNLLRMFHEITQMRGNDFSAHGRTDTVKADYGEVHGVSFVTKWPQGMEPRNCSVRSDNL